MNAETRQRATGVGLARTKAGGVAQGMARVRGNAVTLDAAAKAGLARMRAAAALAGARLAVAPTARRPATKRQRGFPAPLEQSTIYARRGLATAWLARRGQTRLAAPSAAAAAARGVAVSRADAPSRAILRSAGSISSLLSSTRFAAQAAVSQRSVRVAGLSALVSLTAVRPGRSEAPAPLTGRAHIIGAPVLQRLPLLPSTGALSARAAPARLGAVMAVRRRAVAPVETAPAAPLPQRSDAAAVRNGAPPIDSAQIGRWVTEQLTDAAMRPPSGLSGLDDRLTPVFAGMVGFG